jgi:hypothetical protein
MRRLALALAFALAAGPAAAHSWYPMSCCSGSDCYSIPSSDVDLRPDGYFIKPTGELIPYGDARISPPDSGGDYHRCSIGANPRGPTIGTMDGSSHPCFWAPQAAM